MNQSETDLGIVNESQLLRFGITRSSVLKLAAPARHGNRTHGRLKSNGAARAAPFFFVTKTNLTARARAESAEKDEYDLDLCQ
jgi:hypothetical protein